MANTEVKCRMHSVNIFCNIDLEEKYSSFNFKNKITKPREMYFLNERKITTTTKIKPEVTAT